MVLLWRSTFWLRHLRGHLLRCVSLRLHSWLPDNLRQTLPLCCKKKHYEIRYFTERVPSNVFTCYDFQGEEDDDRKPIEHVVDSSCGERSAEFVTISHLGQWNNSVGYRSADIGPHNDRNSHSDGKDWKKHVKAWTPVTKEFHAHYLYYDVTYNLQRP